MTLKANAATGSTIETPAPSNRSWTLISSVGGFSPAAVGNITTLQGLLHAIQPLNLRRYEGAYLHETQLLGEGASYRVFRSIEMLTGSVFAVKKIKLPENSTNSTAFRSRVRCILRDIEVMSHDPLIRHPNILNIRGYGWQSDGLNVLPFLVTEYAPLGTLREYLKKTTTTARLRRQICCQVSSGLHGLHLCGVAHGDLKLENVIVTMDDRLPIIAKLCDFGHSVRFVSRTDRDPDKYCGTFWYNAPEVLQRDNGDSGQVDSRKCDIWALGLLCWETHRQGMRYYEDEQIRRLLAQCRPHIGAEAHRDPVINPYCGSSEISSQALHSISYLLASEARDWVDRELKSEWWHSSAFSDLAWSQFDKLLLKGIFKRTLEADPSRRIDDISRLPLIHGISDLSEQPLTLGEHKVETEWSIAPFFTDLISRIPIDIKREILTDFEQEASLPHNITRVPARASLNVFYAHAARFTDKNVYPTELQSLLHKSVQGGSAVAVHMGDLMTKTLCQESAAPTTPEAYTKALRATIKALAMSEYFLFEQASFKPTFEDLVHTARERDSVTLVAHYSVIYGLTHILPAEYVNLRHPTSRETALGLASRLGDHVAAVQLLKLGADPSICTEDNCSPLHWLFMFDDDHIPEIDLNYPDAINKLCDRPIVLDAQVPADFRGSPLSFAIASASTAAAMVMTSESYCTRVATLEQAWCLASSLHLHKFLDMFPSCFVLQPSFSFGLDHITRSCRFIPRLIHGNNLELAQHLTLQRIFSACTAYMKIHALHPSERILFRQRELDTRKNENHCFWYEPVDASTCCEPPDASIWHEFTTTPSFAIQSLALRFVPQNLILPGINSAIRATETGIASKILEEASTLCEQWKPRIAERIAANISHSCAEVACGSAYEVATSFRMLDFSLRLCADNGYAKGWFDAVTQAIRHHRQDIFFWLMNKAHDLTQLNDRTDRGETLLHIALIHGFTKLCPITFLLSRGSNPNIADMRGLLPLDVAIRLDLVQELEYLLQQDLDTITYQSECQTPLHSAISRKSPSMLSMLLRHPIHLAMLGHQDRQGRTPVNLAAVEGFLEGVRMLLMAGACPAVWDKNRRTPFHYAVLGSNPSSVDILRELLKVPKGVDIVDSRGNTALHLAIKSQSQRQKPNWQICKDIIKAGATLNIVNKSNDSPFTLAMRLLDTATFSLLLPYLLGLGSEYASLEKEFASMDEKGSLIAGMESREEKATLATCMIQLYEERITSGTCFGHDDAASIRDRRVLIMNFFQATFDIALHFKMTNLIFHYLLHRIPVDKAMLSKPIHAQVLAFAIANRRTDIVECYEEPHSVSSLLSSVLPDGSESLLTASISFTLIQKPPLVQTLEPQMLAYLDSCLEYMIRNPGEPVPNHNTGEYVSLERALAEVGRSVASGVIALSGGAVRPQATDPVTKGHLAEEQFAEEHSAKEHSTGEHSAGEHSP